MPTSRTLAAALLGAVLATGCAATADDGATSTGADTIAPSSALDAEGVLILCNDRSVTTFGAVDADVAKTIVAARTGTDGKPHWFASVDEVPSVNPSVFAALVADAKAAGDEEAPGFDPPTQAKITIPNALGHAPTYADVTIAAGFDGLTPTQASAIVKGRITNTIDPSNASFVDQTILANHKSFTIAVGNLFVQNSPDAAFISSVANADSVTLVGTMSSVNPTILEVTRGTTMTQYARNDQGVYAALTANYPIIMRAKLELDPSHQGVRVFYPAWGAKQLAGPTTVIVEQP